jgi:hypothetical protein
MEEKQQPEEELCKGLSSLRIHEPPPYRLWFDRQVRAVCGATMRDKQMISLSQVLALQGVRDRNIFCDMVLDLTQMLEKNEVAPDRYQLVFNSYGWQRGKAFHLKAYFVDIEEWLAALQKQTETQLNRPDEFNIHQLFKVELPKLNTEEKRAKWRKAAKTRMKETKPLHTIKECPDLIWPPVTGRNVFFAEDYPAFIIPLKPEEQRVFDLIETVEPHFTDAFRGQCSFHFTLHARRLVVVVNEELYANELERAVMSSSSGGMASFPWAEKNTFLNNHRYKAPKREYNNKGNSGRGGRGAQGQKHGSEYGGGQGHRGRGGSGGGRGQGRAGQGHRGTDGKGGGQARGQWQRRGRGQS